MPLPGILPGILGVGDPREFVPGHGQSCGGGEDKPLLGLGEHGDTMDLGITSGCLSLQQLPIKDLIAVCTFSLWDTQVPPHRTSHLWIRLH